MDLYIALLLAVECISITAFAYLEALFIRVYRGVRLESVLVYAIFILFLLLSQFCSILSIIVSDSRTAAALYVATSSLALAGFILICTPSSNSMYIAIPIFIASPDILAGLLSTILILKRIAGRTKYFLTLLSLSYYIRGVSTLLTAAQGSPLLLLISEATRAIAVVLLSLHHTAQVLVYGKEEK
ncbi:MAG: hypothetical protein QXV81_01690 [Ignisphaera sp.]|uniref:Uncharacterized protein n=1 Tax=Ignisphaera aggregans TaxID=334771 RepID=A0A7J3JNN8_9CREN